jgi:hypothetical protein
MERNRESSIFHLAGNGLQVFNLRCRTSHTERGDYFPFAIENWRPNATDADLFLFIINRIALKADALAHLPEPPLRADSIFIVAE